MLSASLYYSILRIKQVVRTHVSGGTHGSLHLQDGARDDEVEEPLRRGAEGDVEGPETGSRDLTIPLLDA